MEQTITLTVPISEEIKPIEEMISPFFAIKHSARSNVVRTYFDTFDWLLCSAELALYSVRKQIVLIHLGNGEELLRCGFGKQKPPCCWWEFENTDLQNLLRKHIDIRSLLPISRVHVRQQNLDLLNTDQKTVLRGRSETLSIHREGCYTPIVSTLRISPLWGYGSELNVLRRLLGEYETHTGDHDSLRLALEATGLEPGGYKTKVEVSFPKDEHAQKAAASVLSFLISVVRANEEGIKSDLDTEFLHDFRVAVRKIRSALAQIKGVFPGNVTAQFRSDMASVGKMTNRLRDLDVYLLQKEKYVGLVPDYLRPGVDTLYVQWRAGRKTEKRRVTRYLNSDAYKNTICHWVQFLDRIATGHVHDSVNGKIPVYSIAKKSIERQSRKLIRDSGRIHRDTPDADLHALRIRCKKLRYLLEFFGFLFSESEVRKVNRRLKDLQDRLGRFNDLAVQQQQLEATLLDLKANDTVSHHVSAALGGLATALQTMQRECMCECIVAVEEFRRFDRVFKSLLKNSS